MIIYTIIIPHHNNPFLLKRCLTSIPCRDDVQTIVVDDKSDDAYWGDLCSLEKDFTHVNFVYLEQNKGGGGARNKGLQMAKGKYVLFADCDDFFNYCINDILEEYKDSNYDIVFFDAVSLDTETYMYAFRCRHLNKMIHMNPEKALFNLKYVFGEPWCKMINRDLIMKHEIRFDEIIIHNDTKFSYLVGYYSSLCKIDERALYCVTDRIGSVSKKISIERQFIRTKVFAEANAFFREHSINRFEMKALRPLMYYLTSLDFDKASECVRILKSCGMTNMDILMRIIQYPFIFIKKGIKSKFNKIIY